MNSLAPLPAEVAGVHYGAGTEQFVNVYGGRTAGATSVILVHGGAWAAGAPKTTEAEAEDLQAQGFCVFNMAYREVGKEASAAYPTQVEDVELAVEYVKAHAGTYKGSTGNIIIVGGSSGAAVSEVAALKQNTIEANRVRGIVTLSGMPNLKQLLAETEKGEITNKTWTEALPKALGQPAGTYNAPGEVALAEANSASLILTAGNKPEAWLSFNSSNELVPIGQQTKLKEACEAVGCPITAEVPSTGQHAFTYWGIVRAKVIEFINAH